MKRTELLQKWLELKDVENKAKEERVALEEQIWNEFESDTIVDGKLSGTMSEENYKLTIKLNPKFKITDESLVPEDADIYKQVIDEKKLAADYEEGAIWVEKIWNKPTFTILKTK